MEKVLKKKLGIGLIGFGTMGKVHSYAVNNLDYYYSALPFEARIVGVATSRMETAAAAAEKYHIPFATDNEDDLIYNDEVDVIDICTPNVYHFETLKKAISAGKAIYCEKPLCTTAEEARKIAELAREKGVICNVVFNNRHLAPALRAKELIDEGRIGRVLSFNAEYLHNSCTDPLRPAGWKQNKDICGGGVLFDLGSHAIDLIYYLCGRFESVSGVAQIGFPERTGADGNTWQTNADEAFYMTARLCSGAVGQIAVSKLVNGANDDLSVSVYGEKGSLSFSIMQPNFLYFYNATEKPGTLGGNTGYTAIECVGRYPAPGGSFPAPKASSSWIRGHVEGLYRFLDSAASGIPSAPDFSDGAHIQAVMEAAYRSSREMAVFTEVEDI